MIICKYCGKEIDDSIQGYITMPDGSTYHDSIMDGVVEKDGVEYPVYSCYKKYFKEMEEISK